MPASAGPWSGAGAVGGCPSPAAGGEGAGAAGAGVGLAGAGGDCGDGEGDVCANAPAQSDEINKEVDANNRGRNDTEAPCREVGNIHPPHARIGACNPKPATLKSIPPNSPSPAWPKTVPVIGAILLVVCDVVNNCAY